MMGGGNGGSGAGGGDICFRYKNVDNIIMRIIIIIISISVKNLLPKRPLL